MNFAVPLSGVSGLAAVAVVSSLSDLLSVETIYNSTMNPALDSQFMYIVFLQAYFDDTPHITDRNTHPPLHSKKSKQIQPRQS